MNKILKGFYRPKNKEKYKGRVDNIVFRSSLELQFMRYCDLNPAILEWSSEEIVIPYISPKDKKIHRYYVDFWIKYISEENETDKNGIVILENNKPKKKIKKALIEIKSADEIKPPKQPARITDTYKRKIATWLINMAKWQAAKNFATKYNMEFKIITEKQLKNI